MFNRRLFRRGAVAVAALVLLGQAGCGSGPKTHPVKGKVEFPDGNLSQLAESNVEFRLEGDPNVRVYALIGPDGSFEAQMLHQGKSVKGAPEGTYRARILLANDEEGEDDDGRRLRPSPVHPRYLKFETAGLTYKVPADGEIIVKVSRR